MRKWSADVVIARSKAAAGNAEDVGYSILREKGHDHFGDVHRSACWLLSLASTIRCL
jgi:hypothetical protein